LRISYPRGRPAVRKCKSVWVCGALMLNYALWKIRGMAEHDILPRPLEFQNIYAVCMPMIWLKILFQVTCYDPLRHVSVKC
jgi:hypothetical protein